MSPNDIDGIPKGLTVLIGQGNPTTYVDRSFYINRESVKITRPKPGEPGRMQFTMWSERGTVLLDDLARIRAYDNFTTPAGLFPRHFAGYVVTHRDTVSSNINLEYALDCADYNWLWQNPPAMPYVKTRIGAAPVWLPGHQYFMGDEIQPYPSNGHKYTVTALGASGTGISNVPEIGQPAFPTGTGATVVEGLAGPPDTRITWTESGSSVVSDVTAINQILDIYFPASLITITRTGIKPLIASVPSIEIDVDWLPERAMQEVAKYATSTTYFEVNPSRANSTPYAEGDFVEPPTPNGFVYRCKIAGTSGGSPPTYLTTIGVTFTDGGVTWVVDHRLGRAQINVPYVLGQRIEPQLAERNGYYYDCITAGTTGATLPTGWTTTLGGVVTTSTGVKFMCMGPTSVDPAWSFEVPSDNAPHTASWDPIACWYSTVANTTYGILENVIQFTDRTVPLANEMHYIDITVNREGDGYANVWFVFGRNGAFARVVSPGEILNKGGLVVAKSYVDNSDTGPANEQECMAKGSDLLAISTFHETLQVNSEDPLDQAMLSRISVARIKNDLLGIDPTTTSYPVSDASVDFSGQVPTWHFTLGSPFLTDRESLLSRRHGGRQYVGLGLPPALVTWGSDFVLSNQFDGASRSVIVQVIWRSGLEANLHHFNVEMQVTGEMARRRVGTVMYPQQSITVPALPPNTVIRFYVSAVNNQGQFLKEANGLPRFSESPPVTTASIPSRPPTPTITGVVTGAVGKTLYYADVTVDHPTGDHSHGGIITAALHGAPLAPILSVVIPREAVYPWTGRITGVALGAQYDFKAYVIDQYDQYSLPGTFGPVTITPTKPPAPSIATPVTGGFSAALGYFANPVISHPTGDHSHGGLVLYVATTGSTDRPIRSVPIPPNATYPYTATLPHLDRGVTYSITAFVTDQYDQDSNESSPARTYIPTSPPKIGLSPAGWDTLAIDGVLADWLPVSPAVIADFLIDASVASFDGKSSLKMIVPASTNKEIESYPIASAPNEVRIVKGEVKRGSGSGTAPVATMLARFYKQDGTASVGADQTIFTKTPTTSFAADRIAAKIVMPSDAFAYTIVLKGAGQSGASAYNLWWAFPVAETPVKPLDTEFQPTATVPIPFLDENREPVTYDYWSQGGELFVRKSVATSAHPTSGQQLMDSGGQAGVTALRGILTFQGGMDEQFTEKTTDFTASIDRGYICNSSSAIKASLPSALLSSGRVYTFKNTNTGVVTIDPFEQDTVDFAYAYRLTAKNQWVTLLCVTDFSAIRNWVVVAAGVGGLEWKPTTPSGLKLWTPTDPLAGNDGDAIGTLPDLSGVGGDLLQSTGANKPLLKTGTNGQNGGKVLLFDGSNDFLSRSLFSALNSVSSFTVMLVFKTADTSGNHGLLWKGGDGKIVQIFSDNLYVGDANAGFGHFAFTNTTLYHLLTIEFDGSLSGDSNRLKAWLDTVSKTITFDVGIGTTANSTAGIFLGSTHSGGVFHQGQIADLAIWSAKLSSTDRGTAEQFFRDKWGI